MRTTQAPDLVVERGAKIKRGLTFSEADADERVLFGVLRMSYSKNKVARRVRDGLDVLGQVKRSPERDCERRCWLDAKDEKKETYVGDVGTLTTHVLNSSAGRLRSYTQHVE